MSAKRFTGKTESDAVMNAAMELGIPSTEWLTEICWDDILINVY